MSENMLHMFCVIGLFHAAAYPFGIHFKLVRFTLKVHICSNPFNKVESYFRLPNCHTSFLNTSVSLSNLQAEFNMSVSTGVLQLYPCHRVSL